jgi:hypothetical protein
VEEEKPIGVISPGDITALIHILYFYQRWMLATLAPSAKRSRNVSEIEFLTVKLSLLATSKTVILTYDEVEHIKYAIGNFISQIKARMPQSKNRDAVIESSEQLRDFIIATFAEK